MTRMDHQYFPENLRHLVRSYESVKRAADALGLNRQQLNKYLGGHAMPSLTTLTHIARHFGLKPDDLLKNPKEFAQTWRPSVQFRGLPPRMEQTFKDLLANAGRTREMLAQFCGTYHAYMRVPTNPDKIGRACAVVAQEGEFTFIKTIVFAQNYGEGPRCRTPIKASGIVQWLGERIYIFDAQHIGQPHGRFQSIVLYPPLLPSDLYLKGILTTTNNARQRPIGAAPVIFVRQPNARPDKYDLRACGLFHKDDPRLDPRIANKLHSALFF